MVHAKLEALASAAPAGRKKLRGTANSHRVRIGDWRILYEIDDRKRLVDVAAVHHRSKAYD